MLLAALRQALRKQGLTACQGTAAISSCRFTNVLNVVSMTSFSPRRTAAIAPSTSRPWQVATRKLPHISNSRFQLVMTEVGAMMRQG